MKQDKDWTDVMRSTLRDAETPPPADGWARLERELGATPALRLPAWRIHWPRIAAAAAVILVGITVGEYLWYADPDTKRVDGAVIAETVSGGSAADQFISGATEVDSTPALAMATPTTADAVGPTKSTSLTRSMGVRTSDKTEPYSAVQTVAEHSEPNAVARADSAVEVDSSPTPTATRSSTTAKSAMQASGKSARQMATQTGRPTLYGDDFVAYAPPRKKTSFSLHGGGGVTGGRTAGFNSRMQSDAPNLSVGEGGDYISLMKQYDYARGSFRHHQPLSFGLSVRKEFAYGLSLESGVNYTLLRSGVNLFSGSELIDQKLHFIGVPLRMNWQFLERGRFSLYIGAGGMVEKCISARFDGKTVEEPKIQWSVLGAAGAQYRLGGTVALYFEPEVSYYFTETELRTVRNDSPLTLTLRMGVRLSF